MGISIKNLLHRYDSGLGQWVPLTEDDFSGGGSGLQNKYDATAAPDANNDSSEGYAVGSEWNDITNNVAYICMDASVGSAVWNQSSFEEQETYPKLVHYEKLSSDFEVSYYTTLANVFSGCSLEAGKSYRLSMFLIVNPPRVNGGTSGHARMALIGGLVGDHTSSPTPSFRQSGNNPLAYTGTLSIPTYTLQAGMLIYSNPEYDNYHATYGYYGTTLQAEWAYEPAVNETFNLRACQVVAEAAPLQIKAGSYMIVEEIIS